MYFFIIISSSVSNTSSSFCFIVFRMASSWFGCSELNMGLDEVYMPQALWLNFVSEIGLYYSCKDSLRILMSFSSTWQCLNGRTSLYLFCSLNAVRSRICRFLTWSWCRVILVRIRNSMPGLRAAICWLKAVADVTGMPCSKDLMVSFIVTTKYEKSYRNSGPSTFITSWFISFGNTFGYSLTLSRVACWHSW